MSDRHVISTIVLVLSGHLSKEELAKRLARTPSAGTFTLLFDCRTMTGYDFDAREAFVSWHRENRERVKGVAIATDNMLWHVVVSAMALASGQTMRAFSDVPAARDWLAEQRA